MVPQLCFCCCHHPCHDCVLCLLSQEILQILRCAVERNAMRASLAQKRTAFEAWRQVTEVLLTACPEDLLPGETRQAVIFELLQELLIKV